MSDASEGDPEPGPEGEGVYQRLLEGASDHALFMLDPEGRISLWPEVAERLYGFKSDDAVGQELAFLNAEHEDMETDVESLLTEAKNRAVKMEGWHERADGTVFWAAGTVSPLQNDEFDGYAVVCGDTTSSKQYERMLERQNDRLKEFSDILSHDLRSPLSVIDGRLALYRETGEGEHLAAIETTTDRMERLVDDLLDVARQGQVVTQAEPTDISTVLDIAREGVLPESATCEYERVQTVMADPDRLVEMFENLLRNSAEHGGEAVTVRIGPLKDGFFVEDDGPGIPEADRERVFEHGYTTRGDGTGYGLSIVRSIVGAHGWDIAVTDSDNGGARFEITGIEFVSDS